VITNANDITDALFILCGLSLLLYYLPNRFAFYKEQLTKEQFIEKYPDFEGLVRNRTAAIPSIVFGALGLLSYLIYHTWTLTLGFTAIALTIFPIFNGLMTGNTGICCVPPIHYPGSHKSSYFIQKYVFDDSLRKMGWGQVIGGLIIIALSIGLTLKGWSLRA